MKLKVKVNQKIYLIQKISIYCS